MEYFEQLWAEYYPRIYAFLRTGFNFSREDLEDITHETFLRAFRNISGYDSSYSVSTWMYTIARNMIRSALFDLPPRDRNIAFLWYYEEFTQTQIGKIMEMPEGTIKYRIFEIKKILRKKLEEVYER